MKLTKGLIGKLKVLANGGAVPASRLYGKWVDELITERVLTTETHGTHRSYRVTNVQSFLLALVRYNEALRDLDVAERFVSGTDDFLRSEQVELTGNSKIVSQRTCPGFLVNSYERLGCTFHGRHFTVHPPEGSFVFIADWQAFSVASDVLVVGIENMENFREIRRQKQLFDSLMTSDEHHLLFVSRYPQSTDLRRWLQSLPNRYLHFGDFDLAGIHIFLSEFRQYLSERASFMIPMDIEERLANGSRERYDNQYERYRNLTSKDADIRWLIDLIHKFRRGYDQEGFITSPLQKCGDK